MVVVIGIGSAPNGVCGLRIGLQFLPRWKKLSVELSCMRGWNLRWECFWGGRNCGGGFRSQVRYDTHMVFLYLFCGLKKQCSRGGGWGPACAHGPQLGPCLLAVSQTMQKRMEKRLPQGRRMFLRNSRKTGKRSLRIMIFRTFQATIWLPDLLFQPPYLQSSLSTSSFLTSSRSMLSRLVHFLDVALQFLRLSITQWSSPAVGDHSLCQIYLFNCAIFRFRHERCSLLVM